MKRSQVIVPQQPKKAKRSLVTWKEPEDELEEARSQEVASAPQLPPNPAPTGYVVKAGGLKAVMPTPTMINPFPDDVKAPEVLFSDSEEEHEEEDEEEEEELIVDPPRGRKNSPVALDLEKPSASKPRQGVADILEAARAKGPVPLERTSRHRLVNEIQQNQAKKQPGAPVKRTVVDLVSSADTQPDRDEQSSVEPEEEDEFKTPAAAVKKSRKAITVIPPTARPTPKVRTQALTVAAETGGNTRARNFCFTWQNKKFSELDNLMEFVWANLSPRYLIMGAEKAGTTGRPHFQGTICFTNAKAWNTVRKLIPAHVEICKDLEASIEYCKKEGKWKELGEPPATQAQKGKMEQDRWKTILEHTQAGRFELIDPKVRILQCRNLEYIYQRASTKRGQDETTEVHFWFVGPTGTGKSRKARDWFGRNRELIYNKTPNSKWWCNYDGQPMALLDDVGTETVASLGTEYKQWFDRYPFPAENKGGGQSIRPKLLVATSNWWPHEIWLNDNDLLPMLRRIQIVWFGVGEPPRKANPAYFEKPYLRATDLVVNHPLYDAWLEAEEASDGDAPTQKLDPPPPIAGVPQEEWEEEEDDVGEEDDDGF